MKLSERIIITLGCLWCIIGSILGTCTVIKFDLHGFRFVIAIILSCIGILVGITGCILSWVMNRK